MSVPESNLSKKMRALKTSHPAHAEELEAKAAEFDEKIARMYAKDAPENAVKSMLGAWARARRLYSDLTGASLI